MEYLKKLIHQKIKEFFPRAYYLLGWNNEQFAVYYGQEYPTSSCEIGCVGGGAANISSPGPRTVLMWNAEYNTYGNGSNINLTYKYNSDGTWKKYYNINDRLGNVRTVLRKDGTAGTPVKQFFYTPFGSVIPLLGSVNRTKFIGKEKDKESNYGDFGVRKYDDEIGRFTSIDPLWELDYSWTPYHYSYNNPVLFTDGNGKWPLFGWIDIMINLENTSVAPRPWPIEIVGPKSSTTSLTAPKGEVIIPISLGRKRNATATDNTDVETKYNLPEKSQKKQNEKSNKENDRNWKQDKKLTNDDIKKLEKNGYDIHELKGGKNASKYDLYKDDQGNVYQSLKGNKAPGEPLNINLNNL